MRSILKSGIVFSLLFTCLQVNAQVKTTIKKPVNNLGGQDLGIKRPKTTTTHNNLGGQELGRKPTTTSTKPKTVKHG